MSRNASCSVKRSNFLFAHVVQILGQHNYSECVNYIQWKFEQLNRSSQRDIYCHHTCATDTNNVQFVLDACLDMIIAKNLKSMGLC